MAILSSPDHASDGSPLPVRSESGGRWQTWAMLAAALLLTGQLAWHAHQRTAFNIRTETDYVAGFHMEAARFLAGEPLLVRFHPPGYPALLAAVQAVVGDWFTTGLAVSVASAAGAVFASVRLWHGLAGATAAWGVLAAWAVSMPFLHYAVQTTSDLFGLAVYQCIWLAAWSAWRHPAAWRWGLLGLGLGYGWLVRSDLIITAPLVALPVLIAAPWRIRLGRLALVLAVAAIPLGAWLSYARATSSPAWPSLNYANVALTYFSDSDDQISGDAREPLEERFHSLGEVLRHDPARIASQYARDLQHLPLKIVQHVTWWPVAALGVAGLALLAIRASRPFVWIFAGLTLGHLLMTNLKAFESRYYLFTVPWLGAGAGVLAAAGLKRLPWPRVRQVGVAVVALGLAAQSYRLGKQAYWLSETRWYHAEVLAAAAALREASQPGDVVCVRKPNLAYYAGQRLERSFPHVTDLDSLGRELSKLHAELGGANLYLFYGSLERSTRPELDELALPRDHAPWLILVARGDGPAPWMLYRFVPSAWMPSTSQAR